MTPLAALLLKVRVDNLQHVGDVGLPYVLDLAIHQVNFLSWISQGDHSETLLLLLFTFFTHVILVSAQCPNPSLYLTWGTDGTRAWTLTWTRA